MSVREHHRAHEQHQQCGGRDRRGRRRARYADGVRQDVRRQQHRADVVDKIAGDALDHLDRDNRARRRAHDVAVPRRQGTRPRNRPRWRARGSLSGFSGSAATAIWSRPTAKSASARPRSNQRACSSRVSRSRMPGDERQARAEDRAARARGPKAETAASRRGLLARGRDRPVLGDPRIGRCPLDLDIERVGGEPQTDAGGVSALNPIAASACSTMR